MTDQQGQPAPDRRSLVAAFARHVSGAKAGGGGKMLAAVLVAVLAGGVVMGVGYMTRPAHKVRVAASASDQRPAVTVPGSGASAPSGGQATAPGQAAPDQTVPGQATPGQTVPGQVAPDQTGPDQTAAGEAGAGSPPTNWPGISPSAAPSKSANIPASAGSSSAAAEAPNLTAGPQSYAAVTGYGCASSGKASFSMQGWYSDGLNGFISERTGGLHADGCNGSFDAMPMSGSTTYDDPGNYALWTFHTGPVEHGNCHIDVYVPASTNVEQVGGHPAIYQVYGAGGISGQELGTFDIDQTFNHGQWVSRHNWPITNGTLTVKLDSYGIDFSGSTPTHAHIAMSAVSATCVP